METAVAGAAAEEAVVAGAAGSGEERITARDQIRDSVEALAPPEGVTGNQTDMEIEDVS